MSDTTVIPRVKLKLLMVEDNPHDAELILRRLHKDGWDVEAKQTENQPQFIDLIEQEDFDIILADYELKYWNGLDVLRLLHKAGKDIPLILITGMMGEEVAVECIHQGAADYVLKDSLSRLSFAIRRACKERRLSREKRRMDSELRASEERFRFLVDGVKDYAIYFLDPAGLVVSWNAGAERIIGYDADDILGRSQDTFYSAEDRQHELPAALLETARGEGRAEHEGWCVRRDGSQFWAHLVISRVVDEAGQLRGFSNVTHDITERRTVELGLRRNAERSHCQQAALAELIRSDAIHEDQLEQAIREVCEISARTLGVAKVSFWRCHIERASVSCLNLFELISGEHFQKGEFGHRAHPAYFQALKNFDLLAIPVQQTPSLLEPNESLLESSGAAAVLDVPVYVNGVIEGVLCHEHQGNPRTWTPDEKTFALALANVISLVWHQTERNRAELALKDSETRFRQLAEAIQQVFWLRVPQTAQVIYVSPAYEKVWGRSAAELKVRPQAWLESVHPEDRAHVRAAAERSAQTGEYSIEYRIVRPDGSFRWIRDRGFPVFGEANQIARVAGIADDITEHKQLEAQFLQAQKMDTVGRLAGGVAHDFNNMLTGIRCFAQLALDSLPTDSSARADLEQVMQATLRAEGVTRRLLAFARQQVFRPEILDTGVLLRNLQKMLVRLIREDIELVIEPGEDAGLIKADPAQLEQVVINLVVNAVDAMPLGGRLSIRTRLCLVDKERSLALELPPGPYVLMTVSDTGIGMSDEVKAHLFEPFFTTKGVGEGTGLGLATVYGIVRQSGAQIHVDSLVGGGTTFFIYFPITSEVPVMVRRGEATDDSLRGTETILVVEDEPDVRNLIVRILKDNGYTVMAAANGEEALKLATLLSKVTIDLIVSDLIMPKMGGVELITAIRTRYPQQAVLFVSGYSQEFFAQDTKLLPDSTLMEKPFTPDQLLRAVKKILNERNGR